MGNVVLITGVSRFLGTRLAAQLSLSPAIDRLIGVDTVPPRDIDVQGAAPTLGRAEFVRADIGNPLIAKVITQAGVDIVVHAAPQARNRPAQAQPRDRQVTGTMQLLAGCQTSDTVSRVVLASTTAVYGASPRDPAVFTEASEPARSTSPGYAREAVEVEHLTRGFARRRPDIAVTILRLANLIGPTVDTALTRYLAMPVVPSALGFDPRLQLLHEDDAVAVLERAALADLPGVFNVAGEGMVPLSQAVRWARRMRVPVWSPAISLVGSLVRNTGVIDVSAEEARFLNYGRVVDTTKLRTQFGYAPLYTTQAALRSYLTSHSAALPRPGRAVLDRVGRTLARQGG